MIPRFVRRTAVGLLLGGLLASTGLGSAPAGASPLGDAKARAAALRHQVDDLRHQAELATERYDEVYADLGKAVNDHIAAQRALDAAKEVSGETDDAKTRRARALYMAGGTSALYATVLQSGTLTEAASRLHQVGIVLNGDAAAVRKADRSVTSLTQAEKVFADTAKAATRLQKQVTYQASKVQELLARTDALLAAADKRVVQLAEQQRRADAAAAAARAAAALAAAQLNLAGLPDVPASEVAKAALGFAQSQLGKPYVWGATGPDAYDCSGLTGAAYAAAGLALPRTSRQQWYAGPQVALGQLEPGDLLFWADDVSNPATIHHVALYAGNGLMVAAPHSGDVVKVQPVYLDGYIGAVRPGAPRAP